MEELNFIANFIENNVALFLTLIFALVIVTIVLKGVALWKAARLTDTRWFIIMLVINTAGLLELFYIFVVAKKKENQPENQSTQ